MGRQALPAPHYRSRWVVIQEGVKRFIARAVGLAGRCLDLQNRHFIETHFLAPLRCDLTSPPHGSDPCVHVECCPTPGKLKLTSKHLSQSAF